jgi:hypothetical protein
MAIEERKGTNYSLPSPGPYLAKIVSHLDPYYMGTLEVQLMHESGNDTDASGQLHQVKYLSPFLGQSSIRHIDDGDEDYNNTQKSYGMWMIPPDVGGIVVVLFIDGDPRKGYWIGCVQDQFMNFMMPGNAATSFATSKSTDKERVPVAEYNKIKNDSSADPTKFRKPATPFEGALAKQGLLEDDIRGITTSSARREIPSAVFGISTPGPIDKHGKRGKVGKKESLIDQAYVSRLGGSSFVMDDGDDKFIRKTSASDGPPEYAAVEQGETSGKREIPHNELIRLRTRTGHQILMHNSEDLIYISNSRGTTWIELTSDGKIDIYAEDSISFRTKQDFNFYAGRDINFEAMRNINIKSTEGRMQTEVKEDNILIVGSNNTIKVGGKNDTTSGGLFQVNSSGTNIDGGQIHLNSGNFGGTDPAILSTFSNPQNEGTVTSIMLRVPSHEPWPHHENLSPVDFKPAKTDRDSKSSIKTPSAWKKYSTITDTFAKVSGTD